MAGTDNIKAVGKVVKLGTIAILQAVAKDGFQASDLFAPLSSGEFNKALEPVVSGYKEILTEASDLGPMELFGLAQSAYAGWGDVKTELDLALAKIKKAKGA